MSKVTLSGKPADPNYNGGAPQDIDSATGMHKDYWILSDDERLKGFVRPYRDAYRHIVCGKVTTMGRKLSETYAADPSFYGATFCVSCRNHYPLLLGDVRQFTWLEMNGEEKEGVGS